MASSAFVPLIFSVFFFLFLCKAQDIDQKSKSALVEAVFKKVFNLTLASFANIPIEEREKMMDKIELKLKKPAESLDYKSGKYVALIMEGIKSITSENILTNNVDDIFTSSSEDHDKKESIEKQKNKDALEQAMIRTMKKTAEINKVNQSNTKKNEARRMEFKFIDTISVNKVPKDHEDENAEPKNNEPLNEFNTRNGNGIEYVFKDSSNKIDFKNVTFKSPCYVKNNITCLKIKALRTIKCNSKEISIEKLCNGIKDCFDYSDERDCAMQGVDKVRNASQIMSDIEQSLEENCYTAKMNDSILAEQHEILRNVLQNQIKFIEKHGNVKVTTYSPHSYLRNFYSEPKNVMKAVNEVAAVVTKLSSALENTLCSSTVEEELYQKANDIYHDLQRNLNSEPMTTSAWAPITCSCKKDYCVGKCPEQCFTICLQRYYLDRWQCKAVAAQNTISLDLICDGKFDCFDEADEKGCSAGAVSGFAKFEARKMYSLILDMISTKVQSTNFDKVRYKLINLQKQIEKLQILTTKRKVNPLEVKILRDICFSEMKAIYEQTRFYAPSMDLIYDIYSFLLSVNLKLVSAMMYSHTGNVRIIDSDGCFCRDSKCVLPVCSKTCNNTCLAEPKLTRYFCGGHKAINQSKPIEAICDGKDDCPDKDDEMDCSKDICRKHHLILLSHKLQEAVERNSDTTFGEVLLTWNEKVSATLLDTQAYGRPTPAVLRDVIRHMLYDLTLSYGHLASTMRRSNDGIIDHFSKIALIVMSSLKTCAK